ncbi:PAC2 family protein [Novipirellula herctigrandis]
MSDEMNLKAPWLVAVWPGMGHVALSAGYFLMAKLNMHQMAEFSGGGLFDVDFAMIKDGVIQNTHQPRSRLFLWKGQEGKRDIIVFIGEQQPPRGKYAFCENLIDFARDHGVERIFTFAAMATEMHPEQESRIFAAATDTTLLKELDRPEVRILQEGHIGGLNGVLLGVAKDKGMPGICLLGEMPHVFAQVPFPKASLTVLKLFAEMAEIQMDFTELAHQAEEIEHHLGDIVAKLQANLQQSESQEPEEEFKMPEQYEGLSEKDEQKIESLFEQARQDRSKAYELKSELDRLEIFDDYEDRFLDLFSKPQHDGSQS